MARQIVVTYRGEDSAFDFVKLDRSKLYGSRRRVVVDRDGEPCRRAELTDDGATVIQPGMTAQAYFAPDGTWIPHSQLMGIDDEGTPAPTFPRTIGVPQPLKGPVPPETLLDCQIQSVHMLDPAQLSAALAEALDDGEMFQFAFGTRDDHHQHTGFLLSNEHGAFALIGAPAPAEWAELDDPVAGLSLDDDDDDDELDFEMF